MLATVPQPVHQLDENDDVGAGNAAKVTCRGFNLQSKFQGPGFLKAAHMSPERLRCWLHLGPRSEGNRLCGRPRLRRFQVQG